MNRAMYMQGYLEGRHGGRNLAFHWAVQHPNGRVDQSLPEDYLVPRLSPYSVGYNDGLREGWDEEYLQALYVARERLIAGLQHRLDRVRPGWVEELEIRRQTRTGNGRRGQILQINQRVWLRRPANALQLANATHHMPTQVNQYQASHSQRQGGHATGRTASWTEFGRHLDRYLPSRGESSATAQIIVDPSSNFPQAIFLIIMDNPHLQAAEEAEEAFQRIIRARNRDSDAHADEVVLAAFDNGLFKSIKCGGDDKAEIWETARGREDIFACLREISTPGEEWELFAVGKHMSEGCLYVVRRLPAEEQGQRPQRRAVRNEELRQRLR
jgi:hypothetical protein